MRLPIIGDTKGGVALAAAAVAAGLLASGVVLAVVGSRRRQ